MIKAILTVDPAGTSDTGLALRSTDRAINAQTKRARLPEWYWSGNVWTSDVQDQLAVELYRVCPAGGDEVLFVTCATMYHNTAFGQGTAVGCIRGLLVALNLPCERPEEIADVTWRKALYSREFLDTVKAAPKTARRAMYKNEAVATVRHRYGIEDADDNAAEAILLNDYVAEARQDLWLGK